MLPLYLACLGFGGVLIGASVLLGGHDDDVDASHELDIDHDVDMDVDMDIDVDADVDIDADIDVDADADMDIGHDMDAAGPAVISADVGGEPLTLHQAQIQRRGKRIRLPFLSLRFWSFSTCAFGLTGSLLHLAFPNTIAIFVVSSFMGLSLGTAAATAFQYLKSDRVSTDLSLNRMVGREGKVLIPIRPGDWGQVAFQTMAGRAELRASTRDDATLDAGTTVLCTHIEDGMAWVTALKLPATKA